MNSSSSTLEVPLNHTPTEDMSNNLNSSSKFKDRLILGTKEIEFIVPQTLSPMITLTHGRNSPHGFWSGDSSPGSGRSESDLLSSGFISRGNTPSPLFFSSQADLSGTGCYLYGLNPELYTEEKNCDDSKQNLFHKDGELGGYVYFETTYEQDNETLRIKHLKGHLLKWANTETTQNIEKNQIYLPRVRIFLYPDENPVLKSSMQAIEKEKSPNVIEYEDTFAFQVSETELRERFVQICFDTYDNKNRKYIPFGYVRSNLRNIDWTSQKQIHRENLIYISKESHIEGTPFGYGEIFVSLCYNPNISRLTLSLFEIKGIKCTGNETGVYAKILFNQNIKNVKTKKTTNILINGDSEKIPSFNESFDFKLSPDQIETANIIIHVRLTLPGYNKYHEIGKVILGPAMFAKGKGVTHWSKTIKKQKEQIRCWHPIS